MYKTPEDLTRIVAKIISVLAEENLTVADAEYVLSQTKRTVADKTTVQPVTNLFQSPE